MQHLPVYLQVFERQQSFDFNLASYSECVMHIPWYTSSLHSIGNSDIIGPDIKLPLVQTDHSTEHRPSVDTHSHAQIKASLFCHTSECGRN